MACHSLLKQFNYLLTKADWVPSRLIIPFRRPSLDHRVGVDGDDDDDDNNDDDDNDDDDNDDDVAFVDFLCRSIFFQHESKQYGLSLKLKNILFC